MQLGFDFGFLA